MALQNPALRRIAPYTSQLSPLHAYLLRPPFGGRRPLTGRQFDFDPAITTIGNLIITFIERLVLGKSGNGDTPGRNALTDEELPNRGGPGG